MAASSNFRLLAGHPLWIRLLSLYGGLALFGFSGGLVIESRLGNFPWDVLHEGVSLQLNAVGVPVSIGAVAIAVSFLLLLVWIPLRQMPGLGTVSNAVLVGIFMDLTMAVVPDLEAMWLRILALVLGIGLNGAATVLYIIPNFGPGPRDGLMTGLVQLTGRPVWIVRLGIEIVVLAVGWLLGGTFGLGTVAYAVGIGYVTQLFLGLAEKRLGRPDALTGSAD
ncbi:YczE/YyaS/YitT family protein [Brevibacterium album]|uniref:membrane protein YczE n=1 Tax=Brevibacterium album TaxID=417948 RepID=UPI0004087834|nr:membrane protein [Brevibacterium album]